MTTNSASNAAGDAVLNIVKAQHDVLNQMLDQVAKANESGRKAAMGSLERFLGAHEAAEAAYLEQANKNLENAQSWMDRLNAMDVTSKEFPQEFTKFQTDLIKHTQTEVTHTIPKALQDMTQAQLDLVQAAFQRVSEAAEPLDK